MDSKIIMVQCVSDMKIATGKLLHHILKIPDALVVCKQKPRKGLPLNNVLLATKSAKYHRAIPYSNTI